MINYRVKTIDPREEVYAHELLYNQPAAISYVETDGFELFLISEFGFRYKLDKTLNQVFEILPKEMFVGCGENYIVNKTMVQELWVSTEPLIVMSCGNIIPIPSEMIFKFRETFNQKEWF